MWNETKQLYLQFYSDKTNQFSIKCSNFNKSIWMTNSKIFIQNTTKMIHLKKYIRKVKHAAPILYFVWQFCLNQWELIQYNLSFPFYWSRTYLSHQTSHRNVSGPQIFPLSQPYKFSDSMCILLTYTGGLLNLATGSWLK